MSELAKSFAGISVGVAVILGSAAFRAMSQQAEVAATIDCHNIPPEQITPEFNTETCVDRITSAASVNDATDPWLAGAGIMFTIISGAAGINALRRNDSD